MARQPLVGPDHHIVEVPRLHSDTPQLVGLLCTSDLSLYLTTHNTHNRQISMRPRRFEPAIPASEGPQNHVLDRAATGVGCDNSHPYTI